MTQNKTYEAFVEAYNNFDSHPLSGETLKKFYVDDFTREFINNIITIIKISKYYKKLLIIGHRGCGKSTILNKVAEELEKDFFIVIFSAADVLNMMDVSTIDILLMTYIQVLKSMKKEAISHFITPFEKMMDFIRQKLKIKEVGIDFLNTISLKLMIESDTRSAIRDGLRTQIEILQRNLSQACRDIYHQIKKDILIVIDDLDKLETKFAEQIFFKDSHLLTLPETKIIFTFPLDTYYNELFIRFKDKYDCQFIPLVNLYDFNGNYQEDSLSKLQKLVFERIDEKLVSATALKNIINKSGGLLRDLIKSMQDACKIAIGNKSNKIDDKIVEQVVSEQVNEYYRLFDFSKYETKAKKIMEIRENKADEKIDNETLMYFLRYLFVLEYRHQNKLWYDVHPYLRETFRS